MTFPDSYGEDQAYRAGLGDSYYPPNEEEEENDMAIEEEDRMSTAEKLTYANTRLALAMLVSDAFEIAKWKKACTELSLELAKDGTA